MVFEWDLFFFLFKSVCYYYYYTRLGAPSRAQEAYTWQGSMLGTRLKGLAQVIDNLGERSTAAKIEDIGELLTAEL